MKCKFVNQADASLKTCQISYGPEISCRNLSHHSQGNPTTASTVEINLPRDEIKAGGGVFCYTVTANSGTKEVLISGLFSTGIHI